MHSTFVGESVSCHSNFFQVVISMSQVPIELSPPWERGEEMAQLIITGKPDNYIPLLKLEFDHVFLTFALLLIDRGVCFPFNNGNDLNLQRNHKTNREK